MRVINLDLCKIDKNNQKLVELRRKSVNEYNKLRDTTGGEDSGEYNVF